MQDRANAWASDQLVGLIEEVYKGLEGLRRGDTGRLLNARFGLSWLLSKIVRVQRGILISGDNAFYGEVGRAVGAAEWTTLRRAAFGIEEDGGVPVPVREQVVAGLRLYVLTAAMLEQALSPHDATLIHETVELITRTLARRDGVR